MLKPNKLANNNFLSSLDLSKDELIHILELAKNFKNKKINNIIFIYRFIIMNLLI